MWKKTKSQLTINSEIALVLFVRQLLEHVLFDYLDGSFAPQMIGFSTKRFITTEKILQKVNFQEEKFCEGSVFKKKNFMTDPFLGWNILWRVFISGQTPAFIYILNFLTVLLWTTLSMFYQTLSIITWHLPKIKQKDANRLSERIQSQI